VTNDAASWLDAQLGEDGNKPVMFELVDQGFDVWMGNNRANKFARCIDGQFCEGAGPDAILNGMRVDDLGTFDTPAIVEKIHEVTGKKVTYIGYSNGTMQMFYSLANIGEDYWD